GLLDHRLAEIDADEVLLEDVVVEHVLGGLAEVGDPLAHVGGADAEGHVLGVDGAGGVVVAADAADAAGDEVGVARVLAAAAQPLGRPQDVDLIGGGLALRLAPVGGAVGFGYACFLRGRDRLQQMRGSCSPASRVTTRSPPTRERRRTIPGCSATTSPMTAASRPSGWRRIAPRRQPASSGGTTAISFPSLAT